MKTLVKDGKSIYLFEQIERVEINSENIVVGGPVFAVITDCNSSDTTLYENVTPPEDWVGHKYLFDGSTWTLNPDWTA